MHNISNLFYFGTTLYIFGWSPIWCKKFLFIYI